MRASCSVPAIVSRPVGRILANVVYSQLTEHRRRIEQIDLPLPSSDQIFKTLPLQFAPDRTAHQTIMPGHINPGICVHQHGRMLRNLKRGVNAKYRLA